MTAVIDQQNKSYLYKIKMQCPTPLLNYQSNKTGYKKTPNKP